MQPVTVSGCNLNRMTKGVPQIQQRSLANFLLVAGDHLSLVTTRFDDDVFEHFLIIGQRFFDIVL